MAYTDRLMRNSLTTLSSTGTGLGAMGMGDIGRASDYFRTLLGGDRQALMAQAMPGLNLAVDQSAGARRNAAASGSNRTGAGAESEAKSADDLKKNFDLLIGGQKATAAQQLANVSNEELGVMSNILGNVASVSQADVASRRAASAQMWSSLIGGAASIATGGIMGGFKGLLGGPKSTGGTPTVGVPPGIAAPTMPINQPIPWTPPTFGPGPSSWLGPEFPAAGYYGGGPI